MPLSDNTFDISKEIEECCSLINELENRLNSLKEKINYAKKSDYAIGNATCNHQWAYIGTFSTAGKPYQCKICGIYSDWGAEE